MESLIARLKAFGKLILVGCAVALGLAVLVQMWRLALEDLLSLVAFVGRVALNTWEIFFG